MTDVSSQTDFDLVDALRINPFLLSKHQKNEERRMNSPKLKRNVIPVVQKPTQRLSKPIEEECYSVENERRGICLVLEHDVFSPNLQLSGRAGSEVDLKAVVKCFNALKFEVHIHRNLNYADIATLLDEMASDIDHSHSDCFVMFLLSHGNLGTIYAYDAPYPTQKLWEPFTANRAPTLTGKPKLFFIQACQGNQMDVGIQLATTETDSVGFASYKVPMHADFLISHSTISGFYSWRNTSAGSWFIQSLVSLVEKEVKDRDIVSILTNINKKVGQEYESQSSRREFNHKKQTPFFYSTLTMKLYWDGDK